ncbi:MAG: polysaccharide deacetylase family protein [Hydrogenophilales bacterium]|nr:polysaccharide deacetylase family protein [Hydrogenophilales bacterium]
MIGLLFAGTLPLLSEGKPLHVLITVDTESYTEGNPKQQIWGRVGGGGEHGIGKIMDILEAHGVKGTFYINVYEAERHGEETIAQVIKAVHKRGHDVQLHTHPHHKYGIHKLTRADLARQQEILLWGKHFIERHTGTAVIAHRAGAFAANLDTIEALRRIGVKVDASLSSLSEESHLAREVGEARNRPFVLNGILELPITYYVQGRVATYQFKRTLDIESTSLREFEDVIRQAQVANVPAVNVLMHSFSFVRHGRPDIELEERFDRFLSFLGTQHGVVVSTTTQFYGHWSSRIAPSSEPEQFVPATGWWLSYLRAVEEADNGWKNAVVAVALPALMILVIGVLLHRRYSKTTRNR